MVSSSKTEQAIQKSIIKLLEKEYQAYVVKVVAASKSGVPDLLVCIDGKFIGIEVKRPESRSNVSKLQAYNITLIEDSGGFAMVAWDTDMVRLALDDFLGW